MRLLEALIAGKGKAMLPPRDIFSTPYREISSKDLIRDDWIPYVPPENLKQKERKLNFNYAPAPCPNCGGEPYPNRSYFVDERGLCTSCGNLIFPNTNDKVS